MVCTRDIPVAPENGREKALRFAYNAIAEEANIEIQRLHSVLEERRLPRMLSMLWAAVSSLIARRPLPMQTLLFHDDSTLHRLIDAVERLRPVAVYFDGVRSGACIPALRKRFPSLRIVCDFDDLMSRRTGLLAEGGHPISMGYLSSRVPHWAKQHVLDGSIARLVLSYERRALENLESRIQRGADAIVLVSSVDAAHFALREPGAKIAVIPPVIGDNGTLIPCVKIERFIFIGTDSLLQNRESIEFLVDLWGRVQPAIRLEIFGKQTRSYPPTAGVEFKGFVDRVADAYMPGSVLLAPAFIGGGVKTKVLEAMSFGVTPIGTAATFEGIDAPTQQLCFTTAQLEEIVREPHRFESSLSEAGRAAIEVARQSHSPRRLSRAWRRVMLLAGKATHGDGH